MKEMDLNITQIYCPLIHTLYEERPTVGERGYAERVMSKICNMAVDEVGDTLPSHEEYFAAETQAENSNWELIDDYRAINIVRAAIECATERYMGICSAKGCIDRDNVTEVINTQKESIAEEAK